MKGREAGSEPFFTAGCTRNKVINTHIRSNQTKFDSLSLSLSLYPAPNLMNISWGHFQPTTWRPSHAMRLCPITFSFFTQLRQDWRRIYISRMKRGEPKKGRRGRATVSTRNQRERRQWSGKEKSCGRKMRRGGVRRGGVGRVLSVSAPSVPLKLYWSSGERAGGAARNRRTFGASEAGIHGMSGRHTWPPTHPVCSISHSRHMTSNSALV